VGKRPSNRKAREEAFTREELAAERWLPIEGWEGYEVSDLGRVRSWKQRAGKGHGSKYLPDYTKPPRLKMPERVKGTGYLQVLLSDCEVGKCKVRISRAVLEAFVGPAPPRHQAAHRDGVRTNNRRGNLRWATALQNAADKFLHGTVLRGDTAPRRKLSSKQVLAIRAARSKRVSSLKLAKKYGVTHHTILRAASGRLWKHLRG